MNIKKRMIALLVVLAVTLSVSVPMWGWNQENPGSGQVGLYPAAADDPEKGEKAGVYWTFAGAEFYCNYNSQKEKVEDKRTYSREMATGDGGLKINGINGVEFWGLHAWGMDSAYLKNKVYKVGYYLTITGVKDGWNGTPGNELGYIWDSRFCNTSEYYITRHNEFLFGRENLKNASETNPLKVIVVLVVKGASNEFKISPDGLVGTIDKVVVADSYYDFSAQNDGYSVAFEGVANDGNDKDNDNDGLGPNDKQNRPSDESWVRSSNAWKYYPENKNYTAQHVLVKDYYLDSIIFDYDIKEPLGNLTSYKSSSAWTEEVSWYDIFIVHGKDTNSKNLDKLFSDHSVWGNLVSNSDQTAALGDTVYAKQVKRPQIVGKQIRVGNSQGLRFLVEIDRSDLLYGLLCGADQDYDYETCKDKWEFGTLIIPTALLGQGNELTLDTAQALDIKGKKIYNQNADGKLQYTGVLTNIPERAYEQEFTARAYVKFTDISTNESHIVYSAPSAICHPDDENPKDRGSYKGVAELIYNDDSVAQSIKAELDKIFHFSGNNG